MFPPAIATLEYPRPAPFDCQTNAGPSLGHDSSKLVSGAIAVLSFPRNVGHSAADNPMDGIVVQAIKNEHKYFLGISINDYSLHVSSQSTTAKFYR